MGRKKRHETTRHRSAAYRERLKVNGGRRVHATLDAETDRLLGELKNMKGVADSEAIRFAIEYAHEDLCATALKSGCKAE